MIAVKVFTVPAVKRILGKSDFELSMAEASTLDDLLSSLISTYGVELPPFLSHGDGKDRSRKASVTRIMINGRDIEFLNGLETVLHEGDEVLILPIASGG